MTDHNNVTDKTNYKNSIDITDSTEGDDINVMKFLWAASRGHIHTVKKMIAQGQVDINVADYDKRTALHLACSEGRNNIVAFLIESKADLNVKDRNLNTPINDAIKHGKTSITELLLNNGAERPSTQFEQELILAANSGDLETVRRLLENKVNPNCADYYKRTPLHLAAANDNLQTVQLLLEYKADPNLEDRLHNTALTDAVRKSSRIGRNATVELLRSKLGHTQKREFLKDSFIWLTVCFEAMILILHAIFSDYDFNQLAKYPMYQDIHVMIFIGFGFLMTFLRKYGYSSLSYTFLTSALVLQWYPLLHTFWKNVLSANFDQGVLIGVDVLILSDFCAGAILISFGALLGKTSVSQMVVLALFEPIFFALNEAISVHLEIADIGGSMVIHTFGAFFGLAASLVLTPQRAKGISDNAAVYHSDIFAMIGTVFLWIFWPSFNAAFADSDAQTRAVVNTLLSLTGSVVIAFFTSYFLRGHGKFHMIDVQNATLAGGVSIGATANLMINPASALAIGMFSGFLSVWGFVKLQSFLQHSIGLHDTCGVLNLHGMPGFFGGIWSAIAIGAVSSLRYGSDLAVILPAVADGHRSMGTQAGYQVGFLLITITIAISSGLLTGLVMKYISPVKSFFMDSEFWDLPGLEIPYFFDRRGETSHSGDIEGSENVGNAGGMGPGNVGGTGPGNPKNAWTDVSVPVSIELQKRKQNIISEKDFTRDDHN